MSKVIDIGSTKKGKKPKNPDSERLSMGEICDSFAEAINHGVNNPLPTRFPETYRTYEITHGTRLILEIDGNDVAKIISDSAATNAIMRYSREDLPHLPELLLTARKAKEVLEFWRGVTAGIGEVPYVRFKSDPGVTFHRLPFDVSGDADEAEFPTWKGILNRISSEKSRDALCAWIGSLFVPQSYRQQYVWIYGGGGNGKGAIARFLQKAFGEAANFISNAPKEPNQFFTAHFVNKRLVVFPDCENYHFPASAICKTLVGGDPITVERKFGHPYVVMPDCKLLFTSNQLPALSSEKADLRRPIFVRIGDGADWSDDFEELLWDEAGPFLSHCLALYNKACPRHGPILVDHDDSELGGWISTLEENFEEAFDEWFEIDEGANLAPKDMSILLKHVFGKRGPGLEFLKWLDRTHGIRKKTVRLSKNETEKSYPGIKYKKLPIWDCRTQDQK